MSNFFCVPLSIQIKSVSFLTKLVRRFSQIQLTFYPCPGKNIHYLNLHLLKTLTCFLLLNFLSLTFFLLLSSLPVFFVYPPLSSCLHLDTNSSSRPGRQRSVIIRENIPQELPPDVIRSESSFFY